MFPGGERIEGEPARALFCAREEGEIVAGVDVQFLESPGAFTEEIPDIVESDLLELPHRNAVEPDFEAESTVHEQPMPVGTAGIACSVAPVAHIDADSRRARDGHRARERVRAWSDHPDVDADRVHAVVDGRAGGEGRESDLSEFRRDVVAGDELRREQWIDAVH